MKTTKRGNIHKFISNRPPAKIAWNITEIFKCCPASFICRDYWHYLLALEKNTI